MLMGKLTAYGRAVTNGLMGTEVKSKGAPPDHQLRNDIQTLRALAILFVLLFHMWPSRVFYGFLGVDMFFVISGYLMCLILSRKRPINFSVCVEFYYRRVKRIVPLYYFVILIVLVALRRLISPIEFMQLYTETIPALGFYSNIPNIREVTYFDISSKLYYFLHSWSLSVELQFYLIVPLIFVFFDQISKFHPLIKLALVSGLPVASFVFQCYASKDFAHMLLPSRIWQFFVGFGKRQPSPFIFNSFTFSCLLFTQTTVLRVLQKPIKIKQHELDLQSDERSSAFVFSSLEVTTNRLFLSNWRPLVVLGNISYSVYLIHWPLFIWYRYANFEIYVNGGEPNFITGITLIVTSIALGYLIENAFKWLLKVIDGWTMLLFLVSFLLYLNGIQLYDLCNSAVDLDAGLSPDKKPEEWKRQFRQHVEMLWLTRANPPNLTKEQVSKSNADDVKHIWVLPFCDNYDRSMPTNYPLNLSSYGEGRVFTCHARGNGTKNIVVIGNSHAFHNFPGISYIFRQSYKRLTMFAVSSCLPTSAKFQQPTTSEQHVNQCMDLLNATIPALSAWRYPIDIVVSLFAMVDCPDYPLSSTNIEEDELYLLLKSFYVKLAEIPREALFIIQNNPIYSKTVIREIEARIKTGKPLNTIGATPQFLRQQMPLIASRLEHLECPKCIKLDLISFWCNRTHDGFFHATSPQGIAYFLDDHHPTALGSFYNAEYMYRLYRKLVT
ncbi:hypothetical protein M3Y94_00667200 [Aphelenchoides besseyi]|nr:hypothetical protein M3Y94_00667200 [Aphelenchoides besseyi]